MQNPQNTPAPAITVVAPATPQANPAPLATPAPAAGSGPMVLLGGPDGATFSVGAPKSRRDIDALKARRSELSNQLESVDGRRRTLMNQLKSTGDPVAVRGLEARLQLLDARQLQLEADLATTGQLLSSPSAGQVSSTSDPSRAGGFSDNQVMALSVLSIIFIFFPLAIGVAKSMWRRSNRSSVPPQVLNETAQRLERLESSVDAIAVEVERISEGQRFVTKLLSEGQGTAALGAGAAEKIRA
jgi:archaellum component FlaC